MKPLASVGTSKPAMAGMEVETAHRGVKRKRAAVADKQERARNKAVRRLAIDGFTDISQHRYNSMSNDPATQEMAQRLLQKETRVIQASTSNEPQPEISASALAPETSAFRECMSMRDSLPEASRVEFDGRIFEECMNLAFEKNPGLADLEWSSDDEPVINSLAPSELKVLYQRVKDEMLAESLS